MLQNIDIAVIVADARFPELSLNKELIDKVEAYHVPYIVAFTKKDLISDEDAEKLLNKYPGCLVLSGVKNIGVKKLKTDLQILAKRLKIPEPRIAFIGYPNLGKSALINALTHRARTLVSNVPGTTRGVQWVTTGNLRILDSPGVIPYEDRNNRLVLIGSKNADMVGSPEKAAGEIIRHIIREKPDKLKEYFDVEYEGKDIDDILLAIGEKRKFLKKGGVVDEDRTARTIIREWQSGKLKL